VSTRLNGWTRSQDHRQNERVPNDTSECRSYDEAAADLGVSRRRVRALAIADYLDRCPQHERHILTLSVEAERSWRASAPWPKKALRPMFFAVKVSTGFLLEGL
jgi:hypothetical protein